MSQSIDAIYINGVFRPAQPVNIPEGARVMLTVDASPSTDDVLSDLGDLLDHDVLTACQQTGQALSLEQVRAEFGVYVGSLSQVICDERDER